MPRTARRRHRLAPRLHRDLIIRFIRDAIIALVVLAIVVVLVAYSRLHAGGFSAESEPGALERTLAAPRQLMRLSIPADALPRKNPFREDATVWRTAVDHFDDHCATCHGDDGRGRVSMAENMYPNASDLSDGNA